MREKTITHPGIVRKVEANKAEVSVQVNSACASCEIKGSCSIGESVEKLIEVDLDGQEHYAKGQSVTIEMKQSQGSWALIFAYMLPFVLLFGSLVSFIALGIEQGISGLLSIAMLIPYYLILFLMRNFFKKKFSYRLY